MRRLAFSIKNLFTRPKSAELKKLESRIGYSFKKKSHLKEALAHKSFLRSKGEKYTSSYERLEFLGDAVLGLIVSDFLYQKFPSKPEGALTKMKASLVNEVTLSKKARDFGIGEFLYLSPEEDRSGGRERESILADACEAIIGAAFLDGGVKAAQKVVSRIILENFAEVTTDKSHHNYKGELLELLQGMGLGVPRYDVEIAEGPDHKKIFTIAAYCQGRKLATGKGNTKKEAEQQAARGSLQKLADKTLIEKILHAQKTDPTTL